VSGREDQPVQGAVANDRRVVGRTRAQSRDRALELQLGDVGQGPVGLTQQLVDAAGGDPRVEPHLLDGCSGDQPPVGPGHQVDPFGDDHALGYPVAPHSQDLPLHRANGRASLRRQPVSRAGPRTCRQNGGPGDVAPAIIRDDGGQPVSLDDRLDHLGAAHHLCAGSLARLAQRPDQCGRVDARLVWRVDSAVERGVQARLERTGLAGSEPLGGKAQRLHQLEPPAELGGLVAVERHVQRPALGEPRIHSGCIRQLGREGGPGGMGGQRGFEQALLAPAGLPHRRQHPRRHTRGARTWFVPVEDAHGHAALHSPPGAGETNRPRADDDYIA
jgi:hypothetical protein